MYLHLGQETLVNTRELIGLFDLDTTTLSKKTREFLTRAQRESNVVNVSAELPKSFAIMTPPRGCRSGKEHTVYISQLAVPTLKKRLDGQKHILI